MQVVRYDSYECNIFILSIPLMKRDRWLSEYVSRTITESLPKNNLYFTDRQCSIKKKKKAKKKNPKEYNGLDLGTAQKWKALL